MNHRNPNRTAKFSSRKWNGRKCHNPPMPNVDAEPKISEQFIAISEPIAQNHGQGSLDLSVSQDQDKDAQIQDWKEKYEVQMTSCTSHYAVDDSSDINLNKEQVEVNGYDLDPVDECDFPLGAESCNYWKELHKEEIVPPPESTTAAEILEEFKKYFPVKGRGANLIIRLRLAKFIEQFPYGISITQFKIHLPACLRYIILLPHMKPSYLGYMDYYSIIDFVNSNDVNYDNSPYHNISSDRGIWFTLVDDDILNRETGIREQIIFPNFGNQSKEIKDLGLRKLFHGIWIKMLEQILPDMNDLPIAIPVSEFLFFHVDFKSLLENWDMTLREFTEFCVRTFSPEYKFLIKNWFEHEDEKVYIVNEPRKEEKAIPKPIKIEYPCHKEISSQCAALGSNILSISDKINQGEFHLVAGVEIESPEAIGVRKLAYKDEFKKFDAFLDDFLYCLKLLRKISWVNPDLLVPGLYVVVETRGAWCRGVVYMNLGFNYYSVYLIDWGSFVNLNAYNISYMPKELLNIPSFGISCRPIFKDDATRKGFSDEAVVWNKEIAWGFSHNLYGSKRHVCIRAFQFVEKIQLKDKISYWKVRMYCIKPENDLPKIGDSERTMAIELDSEFRSLMDLVPKFDQFSQKAYDSLDILKNHFARLPPKRNGSMNYKYLESFLASLSSLDIQDQNDAIKLNPIPKAEKTTKTN